MSQSIKWYFIIPLSVILFFGCEEGETDEPELAHPLNGTYTLTEMTINVSARTIEDITVQFTEQQGGLDSIQIAADTQVLSTSTLYTDHDLIPIGGTVILGQGEIANLDGYLPVNGGTGCEPLIGIIHLTSDGMWTADTSTGNFSLDLIVDALDIYGSYTLEDDLLEVTYEAAVSPDYRMISTINHLGVDTAIEPDCITVSTITERVLKLTLNR